MSNTFPKKIIILGGGLDQIFLISTAKKMGLFTLVFDKNPKAPGKKIADYFEPISTRDVNSIKSSIDKFILEFGKNRNRFDRSQH